MSIFVSLGNDNNLFPSPGNSLSAILDGKARLLFLSRDEEYVITMPYAHCKGTDIINYTCSLFLRLECSTNLTAFSRHSVWYNVSGARRKNHYRV